MPALDIIATPLDRARGSRLRFVLPAIILLALLLRVAAAIVLRQPLESDALAYFTMASSLIETGAVTDMFGQHAFYSAGYPLLLAPVFLLVGSSLAVGLAVNLLLAAITIRLIDRLAMLLSGRREAGLFAALAYAVWLPAIWNATTLAKENLSTLLLLGLAWCALKVARGEGVTRHALVGGLLWGAGLVTGGSSLLLCFGMAVALFLLWRRGGALGPVIAAGLAFSAAGLATVAPWLVATDRMVGKPVLTTNAAFNLYLGNNPAATGRFISIADTPLGPGWNRLRIAQGEIGTARILQREAIAFIGREPGRAVELAALKLAYFWQPNFPDAADFAASRIVATIRLAEVLQYIAILVLGVAALAGAAVRPRDKAVLAAMIVGFWAIHMLAYIIVRYRDPVVPLLIVLGAVQLWAWVEARTARRADAV